MAKEQLCMNLLRRAYTRSSTGATRASYPVQGAHASAQGDAWGWVGSVACELLWTLNRKVQRLWWSLEKKAELPMADHVFRIV